MISGPRFPLSIQLLAFDEDYSALIPESHIINKILSRNEYRGVIFTNIKKLGLGFYLRILILMISIRRKVSLDSFTFYTWNE